MASNKYNTIRQYEPLRTPSNWSAEERAFVKQVGDVIDDLYSRFNRLRFEDLGTSLQNQINDIGYRVEISAAQGVVLTERVPQTVLTAHVWKGTSQVTNQIDASRFIWSRFTQDSMADQIWNDAHRGMKSVTVDTDDVIREATFQCDILGEE